MVSLGDTAISLHILQPPLNKGGGVCSGKSKVKTQCQDLAKFQFSGGGGRGEKCSEPNARTGCSGGFRAQILPCHFLVAFASQIVSHILRMWRLITLSLTLVVFK